MQYRTLGNTDIQVSVIAMGCWAFAGGELWGEQDDRDSLEAVSAALDAGINFFDTAEGYGKGYSEEILGKALKGIRDKAVIATKSARPTLRKKASLRLANAVCSDFKPTILTCTKFIGRTETFQFPSRWKRFLNCSKTGRFERSASAISDRKIWQKHCQSARLLRISSATICCGEPLNSRCSRNAWIIKWAFYATVR